MADIDLTLLKNRIAELERQTSSDEQPLKSGGGGGTSDGMDDERLAALEKRFDRLDPKIDGLMKDLAEIKGRVSAMPATWQLLGMVLAIMGATFAFMRFALPQ